MAENIQKIAAEELISIQVINSIDYSFSTGPIMGKWFQGLKEKKFYATKCPSCGRTMTPPRGCCALCVVRSEDFVEVGPKGTVVNYDIAYYASPDPLTGKVRKTPYSALFVMLDGSARGIFAHEIKDDDIPKLKRGVRVRPVWNEVRTGSIHDLLYFEIDG